jgi:hypothetical protein
MVSNQKSGIKRYVKLVRAKKRINFLVISVFLIILMSMSVLAWSFENSNRFSMIKEQLTDEKFVNRMQDDNKVFSVSRDNSVVRNKVRTRVENTFHLNKKIDPQMKDFVEEHNRKGNVDVIITTYTDEFDNSYLRNNIEIGERMFAGNVDINRIEYLSRLDNVNKIYPDLMLHETASDGALLIGSDIFWDAGFDGTGITVAVVDSGIYAEHTMLNGNVVQEVYFNEDSPEDGSNHGTPIAGVVATVAPGADLFNVKVLDSNGNGQSSKFILGINWAVQNGADVITISAGRKSESGTLQTAVDNAIAQGVIMVISSGNCGPSGTSWCGDFEGTLFPARHEPTIAVGATTKSKQWIGMSGGGDYGTYIKPDVVAPGQSIVTASNNGGTTSKTGTSFSTPFVAGAVALLLQQSPDLSQAEVKALLEDNALDLGDVGKDIKYGSGFVDLSDLILEPECYQDSECGTDYYENISICGENSSNIYDTFHSFECVNPGVIGSYCQETQEVTSLETCDENSECDSGACVLKTGCDYDNPACSWFETCTENACELNENMCNSDLDCGDDYECLDNACTLKQGCDYSNPSCLGFEVCSENACSLGDNACYTDLDCGADHECLDNTCTLKQGCAYDNPICSWFETCTENACVLNENMCNSDLDCDADHECLENTCTLKQGCDYSNPSCSWFETCTKNACVLNENMCNEDLDCDADQECLENACTLKQGCDYENPVCSWFETCTENACELNENMCNSDLDCGDDYECLDNACTLKQGCDYSNPSCSWFEVCSQNSCILGNNACYTDLDCDADQECIGNQCALKQGCDYDNPSCQNGETCFENVCYQQGEEVCGDGLDNDGDGYFDCHDYDCSPAQGEPYKADAFCTLKYGELTCCMNHFEKKAGFVTEFQLGDCLGNGRYPIVNAETCEAMAAKYNYEYLGEILS